MRRRLLLTGPIAELHRYADAVRQAGWEPHPFPLLEVREIECRLPGTDERIPDWICVTSRNAVASLVRAEELRGVPCATVGKASAALLREHGFRVELEGLASAAALAQRLLERLQPGSLVLWPRGQRATELASILRDGGVAVCERVVYETVPRGVDQPIPETEAIFFASPSAVATYCEVAAPGSDDRRVALGIGPTTWKAIEELGGRFARNVVLGRPEAEALAEELSRLLPP